MFSKLLLMNLSISNSNTFQMDYFGPKDKTPIRRTLSTLSMLHFANCV